MSAIEQPETQFERTETARIVSERPRIETFCLVFISLVTAIFLLRYAEAIVLPFVLSLLMFYALDPIVSWMSRFRVPRIVSGLLLVSTFLGTGASGAYLLRGQASDMVDRIPEAMRKAKAAIESHRRGQPGRVARVQKAAGLLETTASKAAGSDPAAGVTRVQIEEPIFKASDYRWSGSIGVIGLIGQAVTVVFLFCFLWLQVISTKGNSLKS